MNTAEAFVWFIRAFVEKERRESYLYLLEKDLQDRGLAWKGWSRVGRKWGKIERHLDGRYCSVVEGRAWEDCRRRLESGKPGKGVLVNIRWLDPLEPDLDPVPDPRMVAFDDADRLCGADVILVYPLRGLALYFHDEYWVWICERPDADLGL